jgi:putative SOS response-associated peptidase YedK
MCGRVTIAEVEEIHAELRALSVELEGIQPRYNVPPSEPLPAVRVRDGQREAAWLRWGLIPWWAHDPAIGSRMANARCETAAEKPAFRDAMRARRCLILVDGFYEWRAGTRPKQPYLFRMRGGKAFAIGGLWESWLDPNGGRLETCTILTTEPNALVAPLHDRMPVIVRREDYDRWLDPATTDPEALRSVVTPFDADAMESWPVSTRVNTPANDDAQLLEPVTVTLREENLDLFG